ncbi:DUF3021 domain-containing protein [Hungatella hathewayi]|uniref:DUF3021 domain-containing protein n=1 Tax=Hungatella hathewayi TaxID=154046 RepID=UPI0035682682
MKRLLRIYLPSSAIAFTIVILFNVTYNLILGNNYTLSSVFVLELAGLIIFIQLISVVCDHIPFQSEKAYQITFFAAEYAIVLTASVVLNWAALTISNFLYTSLLCVFIVVLIDRYFTAVHRHEADEINRLLSLDKEEEQAP